MCVAAVRALPCSYGELGSRVATATAAAGSTVFREMEFAAQLCETGVHVSAVYAGNESTHLVCSDGAVYAVGFNRKGQAGVGSESDAVYPPQHVRRASCLGGGRVRGVKGRSPRASPASGVLVLRASSACVKLLGQVLSCICACPGDHFV